MIVVGCVLAKKDASNGSSDASTDGPAKCRCSKRDTCCLMHVSNPLNKGISVSMILALYLV